MQIFSSAGRLYFFVTVHSEKCTNRKTTKIFIYFCQEFVFPYLHFVNLNIYTKLQLPPIKYLFTVFAKNAWIQCTYNGQHGPIHVCIVHLCREGSNLHFSLDIFYSAVSNQEDMQLVCRCASCSFTYIQMLNVCSSVGRYQIGSSMNLLKDNMLYTIGHQGASYQLQKTCSVCLTIFDNLRKSSLFEEKKDKNAKLQF